MYKLFSRSILEYGAPVWTGALSNKNAKDIERVQRSAINIISGGKDVPYENILEHGQ